MRHFNKVPTTYDLQHFRFLLINFNKRNLKILLIDNFEKFFEKNV